MKLLCVKARNFKNIADDCILDFVAYSKKTSEDKEYELQEIAPGLFTFNAVAFVGKNASGKTSALDLLDCVYSILGSFSLEGKDYSYERIHLEVFFYEKGSVYKYVTDLANKEGTSKAAFSNQKLYGKTYYKTYLKSIYEDEGFSELAFASSLPDTVSILFLLLKEGSKAFYYSSFGFGKDTYKELFSLLKQGDFPSPLLSRIIHLFDENILGLERVDELNYRILGKEGDLVLSEGSLYHYLSSGTTKGILLYSRVADSLRKGTDLLIDEIENHFHKTLVENIVDLYKDKRVNRHHATLYFSTHYPELLNLFNRQDDIYICRAEGKIKLENLYLNYHVRSELSKSRQFYANAFKTELNYDDLMGVKRELIEWAKS